MTTIRIDKEVMQELQRHAVHEGLVFGSPNQVLRRILKLDEGHEKTIGVQSMASALNPTQTPLRRVTGKRILREHPDLPQDLRPYSDREGIFYEWPKEFPAILFDDGGYVIFNTEASMEDANQYLTMYLKTRKVSVHGTISSIPSYVSCDHVHASE